MKEKMKECKVCFSPELVKVTTKDTNVDLVVCCECYQVYELDENNNVVLDHDSKDTEYFKRLDKIFGDWDNVKDIVPYDEVKEEAL